MSQNAFGMTSVLGAIVLVFLAVGWWVTASRASRSARLHEFQIDALRRPWQVWPCRVEEVPEDEWQFVATLTGSEEAREEYQNSLSGAEFLTKRPTYHRVLLLAPDGSVCRSYVSFVPGEVWRDMTDGLGALWLCGDLRRHLVIATPGAERIWLGTPDTSVRPQPRERTGLAEDIARAAGREAVLMWLRQAL
jgi:hypothetical protein